MCGRPSHFAPPFWGSGLLQFLSHKPVSSFTFHNDHPPSNTKQQNIEINTRDDVKKCITFLEENIGLVCDVSPADVGTPENVRV